MFTELFPIIATPDVARALSFYRDALGGEITHEFPGPHGTPAYVGVDVGGSHLGIALHAGADGESARTIGLWVYTRDCDAALERLRAHGVTVVEGPREQPLGERVARVLDPDGNEVRIGQRRPGAEEALESVGASLMSPDPRNYTRPEFERRFLVAPGSPWRDLVEPDSKRFEDTYLRRTHLRLRILSDSATGGEFIKLTKKLGSTSPYMQLTGAIPLSPMEYELLTALDGDRITKTRHYHFYRGDVFAIDVFEGELAGLVLCEVEAGSLEELMRVQPPEYVGAEVTEDPFFSGGTLSRASREELTDKLREMGIPLGAPRAER